MYMQFTLYFQKCPYSYSSLQKMKVNIYYTTYLFTNKHLYLSTWCNKQVDDLLNIVSIFIHFRQDFLNILIDLVDFCEDLL